MFLPVTEEYFKLLGRTETENGSVVFGFTNSELAFSFHGKKLSIDMESRWGDSFDFRFVTVAVFLNECTEPYMRFCPEGRKQVLIFDSDREIDARVRIIKLSEAAYGSLLLYGAETDGTLSPLPHSGRKIEFIGDSITCGFGVEGTQEDPFLPEQENGTKTYAFLTAKALGADAHYISWSGRGVYSNYTPAMDGDPDTCLLMTDIYPCASAGWYRAKYNSPVTSDAWKKWDFSLFRPDMIVLYLGTNDASYTGKSRNRQQIFKQKYISFLADVRKNNPTSQILCLTGVMTNALTRATANAVKELAAQDDHLHYLRLPLQSAETYGIGGCWHPNERMNRIMADKVIKKIRSIMLW